MKTLVIGASDNPTRYSWKAVNRLIEYGHSVVALGRRSGFIGNQPILEGKPPLSGIDTVSLYLSAENQRDFYAYLLALKPARIIFNPGTENPEFAEMCKNEGIATLEECTLVLLSTDRF